jgi:putative ABC transport system permease protein
VDISGDRTAHYFSTFGRLKSGVSLATARLEGNTIAARLKQQYGDDEEMSRMEMLPLQEDLIGDNRPALLLLLSAVGLLLIIACVNVANILLGRGVTRQREIAIRGALGAGGARLMRQLLTESLTLGLLGGGVGILFAYAALRPLSALLSEQAIPGLEPKLDARVLAFTAVVTVLAAVLFGILPALQAARLDLNRVLKESGRGSGGLRARRAQSVLVITEVALAGVLLVGAGLLLRSFSRLMEVPTGFQAERVVSMALTLPNVRYRDAASRARFAGELLERLQALPAVTSAALISRLPLDPGNSTRSLEVKGGPPWPDGERAPDYLVISPEYFRAMGIPLLQGRLFTDHDGPNAAPAVIINETLARRVFSGQNPTDQMVRVSGCGGPNDWCQVVGVVGDVHQHGLDAKPRLAAYVPYARDPWPFMVFVVRTGTETAALTPLLQAAVRAIDKDQPVYNVRTMNEVVSASLAPRRVRMLLIGLFAVLALILSCVGIYGVMAYSVAQRTQEIGIRMTLGAARADIVRLVAFNALKLTAVGVVAGSVLGWALTRFLSKMLYGVQPTDVVTFVGAWTILIITALVACYVPALRATRVDPLVSLRSE